MSELSTYAERGDYTARLSRAYERADHGRAVRERAAEAASAREDEMRFWLQKTELRSQASEQKRLEAQYRAEINMRHSQ